MKSTKTRNCEESYLATGGYECRNKNPTTLDVGVSIEWLRRKIQKKLIF